VDSQFHDESIPAIIASSLLEHWKKHPGWSAVQLESVDRCDSKMQMFEMAMKEHGSCVHHCQPANTWQVDLPDGWNAFLNGLSKNSRKMFRKRAQALDDMRVRWVYDRHDLAEFMPILIELHQKRRNALGDAGCFANRRFEAFLREAALRLLERNQLQAFTLWHGQRPIAADIGFRSQERWLCYQAGIDPEFLALEPGKLANVLILRDAERFGIKVVDFLRGDEPYKQQLKAQPKPFCTVRFSRPNLAGKADHWRWEVTAKTKRWIKTLRHRLTKPKASGSANPVNVPPPGESEV
jgi:CelD/BcsL family acetyltransferase involved in cellulose biosynthesis